ncbi:hypothetical protein BHS09_22190 [Myxococcus xanthus]|uniref:Uncharacterized protein n=1 Tax=Myxococcus xanthus TaxID=34 RepID=A0AAE6KTP4_MYXXA|nr:hypothetical protein BHS09_22190 [Myxococcus xanthus]QDE76748.1 hypothetical protein BHS08_22205 [Myxococcus xanthus]
MIETLSQLAHLDNHFNLMPFKLVHDAFIGCATLKRMHVISISTTSSICLDNLTAVLKIQRRCNYLQSRLAALFLQPIKLPNRSIHYRI